MPAYRRSILWRLAVPDPVRLWSGHGDLDIPVDEVEYATARYRGAGELLPVPEIKQLLNGAADRLDFVVSGVSEATVRLALEDAPLVENAELRLGEVLFDADWQVLSVKWRWQGLCDIVTVEDRETEAGRIRSVSVSARVNDAYRSNPQPSYWTDQDQRRRSSDDAFCNQVAGITTGVTRRFGPR